MKKTSKTLSWLLAFVLIFTSMVSGWIPVSAETNTATIDENTNGVFLDGTKLESNNRLIITYYESADSENVLYKEQGSPLVLGSEDIAVKPYKWHVQFIKKFEAMGTNLKFKAYPDTSIKDAPVGTIVTFSEDASLTGNGTVYQSVYVGDTYVTKFENHDLVELASVSALEFFTRDLDQVLEDANYHLPDLTKLYYDIEIIENTDSSCELKSTLRPTLEMTLDSNTGTPNVDGDIMYATDKAYLDSTKLPTVSLDGHDFYGWKKEDGNFAFLTNVTEVNQYDLQPIISEPGILKALYQEKVPDFRLDIANNKVTNLIPGRNYAYPLEDYFGEHAIIIANSNGEFVYVGLPYFQSYNRIRLNSEDVNVALHSEYVSLKHENTKAPLVECTATTARVTNTSELTDCEFAIVLKDNINSVFNYVDSSEFTGLTPEKEYIIYVRHKADECGFESNPQLSVFKTKAIKTVSNATPNGVTIDNIPEQFFAGSAVEPTLVIKDGGTTLIKGIDYTVVYLNNTRIGTATAAVTFMGNYSGTMTKTYFINKTVSNEAPNGVTIDNIPNQNYTGSAIRPTLVIKDGGIDLIKGIECVVDYSNNTNMGTAMATVTFLGGYRGTMTKFFIINKTVSNETPNGVTIDNIPDQIHAGSAIEPTLVIKDGGTDLANGIDYVVVYSNNTNVGTATATVTFLGNYSGTMTKSFTINHNWQITWSSDETKHWHSCSGCDAKKDVADHTPGAAATATTPQTCTECGYILVPALGSWIVSFDGNGGAGTMSNVSVVKGEQYTLPVPTFTAPANKEFWAWNVGGTEYCPGTSCAIAENTVITAVWRDLETINTPVISPNGGTFSGSQTVTITCGTSGARIYYTTDGTEPTFAGTAYTEPFTLSSSATVKAIAIKDDMINSSVASASFTKQSSGNDSSHSTPTHPVVFNTDGGSTVASMNIRNGSTIKDVPTPVKEGYVFGGWYMDKELTKVYDANATITASTMLYAKWTPVGSEPVDNKKKEVILTIGKKEAEVDGSERTNDVAPIIRNSRTMLPARFVAENLGAKVTWNGDKQEVTIIGKNAKGEDVTILIHIGSKFAYVNGSKVELDSPAFIENGRTYTPVRFIAESLGADVEWIEAEQRIVIRKR